VSDIEYSPGDVDPNRPTQAAELASSDTEERELPGQRTNVVMADGTTFVVRITNRDYLAWDRTAPRRKWGKAEDVPFLAATFMAWTAATREGLTSLPFDQAGRPNWCDAVEDVERVKVDEDDITRPTLPAPVAG